MDRISRLTEMMKQQPGDAFLRHALGLEYVKAGREQDAEKMFREALALEDEHVGTYYHLVSLLIRVGRNTEAIALCEKGLPLCRKIGDDHAWRELNMLYEDLLY